MHIINKEYSGNMYRPLILIASVSTFFTNLSQNSGIILFHSSCCFCNTSITVISFYALTLLSVTFQRYSIGLRSGIWGSHVIILVFLDLKNCFTIFTGWHSGITLYKDELKDRRCSEGRINMLLYKYSFLYTESFILISNRMSEST